MIREGRDVYQWFLKSTKPCICTSKKYNFLWGKDPDESSHAEARIEGTEFVPAFAISAIVVTMPSHVQPVR